MIIRRFRRDYPGEFVLLETRFAGGQKSQKREWVPNPIVNQHISGRAAVIGSDTDRKKFDYTRLRRHRGGLLGSKRLQTYGCAELANQMVFDFYVSKDDAECDNLASSGYCQKSVVYSNARHCVEHPGSFYLVPFSPLMDVRALAVYVAAFDGHSEIFLLGLNRETAGTHPEWIAHVAWVIQAYSSTRFHLVGTCANMPDAWRSCANVECMDYRRFISYCDI
jgi:hypothetical protein